VCIVSARPIKKGEEIFIPYISGLKRVSKSYEQRKQKHNTVWNLKCNCKLCIQDMNDDTKISDYLEANIISTLNIVMRRAATAESICDCYDFLKKNGIPFNFNSYSNILSGIFNGINIL
jgi:hypothetical protein